MLLLVYQWSQICLPHLKARPENNGKHQVSWHSCQSAPHQALTLQARPELTVSQ